MTNHPTPEAVQHWYDAATERREERDRLRAVVARIGQMTDAWEQQLPEVIRTPAVVSALRAALEPAAVSAARPPATDQPALRNRIRRVLCERNGQAALWGTDMLEPDEYGEIADAVLAVLPEPADRADVCICGHTEQQHFEDVCITEITGCACGDFIPPDAASEAIDQWRQAALKARADRAAVLREAADWFDSGSRGVTRFFGHQAAAELRRLAAEPAAVVSGRTADETEAETPYPPVVRYQPEGREDFGWVAVSGWKATAEDARAAVEHVRRCFPERRFRIVEETRSGRVVVSDPEPAVGGAQQQETDRAVAYRAPGSGWLYCRNCIDGIGMYAPLTSDDLPDGGLCDECGTDVLIEQRPKPFTPPAHYRRDDGVDCCVHTIPVGPDSCRECRELADDETPR